MRAGCGCVSGCGVFVQNVCGGSISMVVLEREMVCGGVNMCMYVRAHTQGFTVDNELITPTLKFRRPQLQKYYQVCTYVYIYIIYTYIYIYANIYINIHMYIRHVYQFINMYINIYMYISL